MKFFLFIMAIILWVGLRSYKTVRKQMSDPEDVPQPRPSSRPAYEALFENLQGKEMSFAEEERKAGYFTYESESVQPVKASPKPRTAETKTVVEATNEKVQDSVFDLRQAIVYNTILKAKYVPEMNPSEIN